MNNAIQECPHCNAMIHSRVGECPWCGAELLGHDRPQLRRRLSLGALITIMTLSAFFLWLISLGPAVGER